MVLSVSCTMHHTLGNTVLNIDISTREEKIRSLTVQYYFVEKSFFERKDHINTLIVLLVIQTCYWYSLMSL